MTRGDRTIERAADRLQAFADQAAGDPGLKGKLAQPLAEDAEFLRQLKPSLIIARARGEAPTDSKPGTGTVAPPGPLLDRTPKPADGGGPNPFVVVGIALAAGIFLAKWIDWRGHAHPRR